MKLDLISVEAFPPIENFRAENLSNVVVLAGPNGVGKTRLVQAILTAFRNPGRDAHQRLVVRTTSGEEQRRWGKETLDTSLAPEAQKLREVLQVKRRRGKWKNSAYHIDSRRAITKLAPFAWDWEFKDPCQEELGWDFAFHGLENRYQDTIQSIRKMLGHHRTKIAKKAIELQRTGQREMALDFPDPFQPFQDAFALLLAPKQLAPMELDWQQPRYKSGGHLLDVDTLSSGEREVFMIVMDLVLHQPEDCIIFFDEPELHLHPELSFRLLKTLPTIGARNQFILCTHSADIISSSMEHSVVLVTPPRDRANQAVFLKQDDESVAALKTVGQSLGVISLGRKIVLIEGKQQSLDRDTYGSIIQGVCPEFVLVPSGSRQTSISFAALIQEVLDKSLWGIDFFMLADRDYSLPEAKLAELEAGARGRLKFLPRLQVENYFLDETTIAAAFNDLEKPDSWMRDPAAIENCLRELARDAIPIAVNLWLSTQIRSMIGEIEISLKDIADKPESDFIAMLPPRIADEKNRVDQFLDPAFAEKSARERWKALEGSLAPGSRTWKNLFPGKLLISKFCAKARNINRGHFTNMYIAESAPPKA